MSNRFQEPPCGVRGSRLQSSHTEVGFPEDPAVKRLPGIALLLAPCAFAALDVRDFGARGDGTTKDTAAIQTAIDTAEHRGGGTVMVPAGKYLARNHPP